jgi:hypothetical protein
VWQERKTKKIRLIVVATDEVIQKILVTGSRPLYHLTKYKTFLKRKTALIKMTQVFFEKH